MNDPTKNDSTMNNSTSNHPAIKSDSNSDASKIGGTVQDINFEANFQRLEIILEKMNAGKIGLDESLILYEEADQLINSCFKRLNDAEKKVEMLIKNRATGEIILGTDQKPLMQDFSSYVQG